MWLNPGCSDGPNEWPKQLPPIEELYAALEKDEYVRVRLTECTTILVDPKTIKFGPNGAFTCVIQNQWGDERESCMYQSDALVTKRKEER